MRTKFSAMLALVTLAFTGCGKGLEGNGPPPQPRPDTAAQRDGLLGGECSESADRFLLVDYLTEDGDWYVIPAEHLDRVEDAVGDGRTRTVAGLLESAKRVAVSGNGLSEAARTANTAEIGDSKRAGIATVAAWRDDLLVLAWEGSRGPHIQAAAAVSRDGELSFIGTCSEALYTDLLHRFKARHAPDQSDLQALVSLAESETLNTLLAELLAGPAWETLDPVDRILDPQVMPEALIKELHDVQLRVTLPETLANSEMVVCPFVSNRGWGDNCVRLKSVLLDDGAFELASLASIGDSIEIWILDGVPPFGRGLVNLGGIEITAKDLRPPLLIEVADNIVFDNLRAVQDPLILDSARRVDQP